MNRRDLLVADLKAKHLMRKVLQKHEDDFAPMQEMMNNVPSPQTPPTQGTGTPEAPALPANLPQ